MFETKCSRDVLGLTRTRIDVELVISVPPIHSRRML